MKIRKQSKTITEGLQKWYNNKKKNENEHKGMLQEEIAKLTTEIMVLKTKLGNKVKEDKVQKEN